MSKGESKLIGREDKQVSKFAHQIGFRQPLGCNRERVLTACWLPKEAPLVGIKTQFEHLIAKARAEIVVIAPRSSRPLAHTRLVEPLRFPFRA